MEEFKEKIAEIVEKKLDEDPRLLSSPNEGLVEELMDEVDRCVSFLLPLCLYLMPILGILSYLERSTMVQCSGRSLVDSLSSGDFEPYGSKSRIP